MLHFYLHVNRVPCNGLCCVSDVDECKDSNPYAKKCNNFPGGFNCYCPKGYEGDGLKNGTGCRPTASKSKIVIIALCKYILINCVIIINRILAWTR